MIFEIFENLHTLSARVDRSSFLFLLLLLVYNFCVNYYAICIVFDPRS